MILTKAAVQTQVLTTAVSYVTVRSSPSRETFAQIPSNQVAAGASVDTDAEFTFISVELAGPSAPAGGAEAAETSWSLFTRRASSTRAAVTLPHRLCAREASPAVCAGAAEACGVLFTGRPIQTRRGQTGVLHIFTVSSFKPLLTFALVLVGLSVGACPSVLAGLMGATVVQIFITEQSSPVDVAHALPGLSAAPIHAPRKRKALVTEHTHPAVMTLAFAGFVTETVDLVTPLLTYSFFALRPSPALHADL